MSTNPTTTPAPVPSSTDLDEATGRPRRPHNVAADAIRGALIGVAETVPGVSGGTVALVAGIYGPLIASVKHLLDIPRRLVTRGDWRASARQVDWWLLLPVCLGMALTVFLIAGVMESFVTEQPVASKALFMGMIAMSVIVPFLEIEKGALTGRAARLRATGVFALTAAVAFTLTSLPRSEIVDPPLILTFGAAAIAVCALVLPGVSGSFFLLVVGIYAPTLAAVDTMDIQYLAVFALGALVGLMSFVRALEWLLKHHHTLAMVAAAGLLTGSLRALWPWQTGDGTPQGVGDDWPTALLLFAVGATVVGVVALVQRRLATADPSATAHSPVDVEHRDARYSGAP
ncbi:DUF368 domain-containing protein [Gordonia sp. SID5947]|uniref:DUF368 domain-containing protein n=1 Tax=Gordonia sp. SID5947 TaxID=2690315 RepID=UPI00136D6BCD|nr:DUF368 domain-containing protein [Gordonia sp. SID5947]MYR08335.1 DUF368 domain-containing protein [Gordonia sp. SID5947]